MTSQSVHAKVISGVCTNVMNICKSDPRDQKLREKVRREVESHIRKTHADAIVTLFGSSSNGFGSGSSDVDISVTFEHHDDGKDSGGAITKLKKVLRKLKSLEYTQFHPSARVPVLKYIHRRYGLECDISFQNALAQHNTRLLKAYSQIDKRVRVLGYAFKHFAKICGINDASRGTLSSYAYIILTLYYLQQCQPPVIPVLQELYPEGEQKPEVIVDGRNTWFYDDIDNLQSVWSGFGQNKETVGELWLGLLRFYTEEFNFKDHVVSIRQKALMTRSQKGWQSQYIAIEDPFNEERDLGKSVTNKRGFIMGTLARGRSHFETHVREPRAPHATFLAHFFDARNLVEGSPPIDEGCPTCGMIGHPAMPCPNQRKIDWKKEKHATERGSRVARAHQDQRVGPRNFEFRPREPNRPNLDPETEAEQQQDRENLDPQRPGQPQKGAAHHKRLRAGAQLPRQNRNHARGDQRNESPLQRVQHQLQQLQLQQPQVQLQQPQVQLKEEQAQHQQQRAQRHQKERVPAEGHSGTARRHRATERHTGTAAEDTAERGNGGAPDGTLRLPSCAPRSAPSTMATPPPPPPLLRPPPSPGANGQTPPYPVVPLMSVRLQQQQQLPQEFGDQRYDQWPLGPPSRHTMPSSWPPSLPPPQSQEALQHFSNFLGHTMPSSWPPSLPPPHGQEALQHFSNFLGPRGSHNLPPPHPQAMPLPPSPQQQLLFPCGPPSEPPFSAMPSQLVFLGALCSDHPSQQWDTPSPHWGHEVEFVPSQD